jgi:hypothetical protein
MLTMSISELLAALSSKRLSRPTMLSISEITDGEHLIRSSDAVPSTWRASLRRSDEVIRFQADIEHLRGRKKSLQGLITSRVTLLSAFLGRISRPNSAQCRSILGIRSSAPKSLYYLVLGKFLRFSHQQAHYLFMRVCNLTTNWHEMLGEVVVVFPQKSVRDCHIIDVLKN